MIKRKNIMHVAIIFLIALIIFHIFNNKTIETFDNVTSSNDPFLKTIIKHFRNNRLLMRTNDGQTIFNTRKFVNTITHSKTDALANTVNTYMSNLGPGFSATFIGKTMTPVSWYMNTDNLDLGERMSLVFILDPNCLRIHAGTVFDGNTNARITNAGGPSSEIRGHTSTNFFSQHPIEFDGEDPNFWKDNQGENVGNLVNMYNPLFLAGEENVSGNDKISHFLSKVDRIKKAYETNFLKDPENAKNYINNNLNSGVETEIIVSSTKSENGKLTQDDILCVAVISDAENAENDTLQDFYTDNKKKLFEESLNTWLDSTLTALNKLPVIGISGIALPNVPLSGSGNGDLAEEWFKYRDNNQFLPSLKNKNFVRLNKNEL